MFATIFSGLSLFVLIRHNAAFVVQDIYFSLVFIWLFLLCLTQSLAIKTRLHLESNVIYYVKGENRWIKWVQLMSCHWTFYKVSIWKGTKSVKFPQNSVLFYYRRIAGIWEETYSSTQNWFFFLPGLKILYDTEHLVLELKIICKWLNVLLKQFGLNAAVVLLMISTFYNRHALNHWISPHCRKLQYIWIDYFMKR
jgi:hypothetical protein